MTANVELLLQDLQRYESAWPQDDIDVLRRYRTFVESTPNCCERTHLAGHCTGSAMITCPRGEQVLLLFHPFLQRWLQPGGHADGSFDLLDVALREAEEETGLQELVPYCHQGNSRVPLDLDIHPIPARKSEPDHFHYDLRFLFLADPNAQLVPESPDLKLAWIPVDEVEQRTDEESVLRMIRKLQRLPRTPGGLLE